MNQYPLRPGMNTCISSPSALRHGSFWFDGTKGPP